MKAEPADAAGKKAEASKSEQEFTMKLRTSRLLITAILVAGIFVVSLNAWLAYQSVQTLTDSEYWVSHTWQVIHATDLVLSSLKDAETGMRGYVLTGDTAYLAPYGLAKADLPTELNKLQELSVDNSQQQTRITEMRAVIDQRMQTLQEGIDERARGNANTVRALVLTGTGKAEMDRLRAIGEAMRSTEQDLLKQRLRRATAAHRRADATMIGASILDIFLLVLIFVNLNHERGLREQSDKTTQQLRELQTISDVALSRLTAQDMVKELLERVRAVTKADGVVLCMLEDGDLEVNAASGVQIMPGSRIHLTENNPLYEVIHANRVTTLTDDAGRHIPEGLSREMRSIQVLQLSIDNKPIGLLMAGRKNADAFNDADEHLLSVVADRIAIAIDRARIYEAEHKARQAAETSAAEVLALNEDLEKRVQLRTAELEAAYRELEAFSYSVSHDLRAPLRSVDGISVALEEDYGAQLTPEAHDFLRRIRAGVQKMGQLIDALLQLSRITRADLTREDVDVSALSEEIAADLRLQNPGRNVTFHIQPGMSVEADARLLRVALENLLGNAIKFTAKKDVAVIDLGREPDNGPFFVRDNGAGFDMQYAGKLFNAFQRLHGDRDFQGSGIGLATVSRVIRRHGGKAWAEGAVNEGATFRFTLG